MVESRSSIFRKRDLFDILWKNSAKTKRKFTCNIKRSTNAQGMGLDSKETFCSFFLKDLWHEILCAQKNFSQIPFAK